MTYLSPCRCRELGDTCPSCDARISRAEDDRADRATDTEPLDSNGRDADWNWPRGFGGASW